MIELFTLVLLGAVIVLFRRIDALQDRVDQLHGAVEDMARAADASATVETQLVARTLDAPGAPSDQTPEPEPEPEPQAPSVTIRKSVSVPAVSKPVEAERPDEAAPGDTIAQDTDEFHPDRQEPWDEAPPRFQFDFEDIFGRRLPIWAGGVTLAVAGVLLVRYSIEAGLLSPSVRVALSFLFGTGLLVAAELAYRYEGKVRDVRIRQALAGAGLATLYAGFYLAGTQYGLIGQTAAFVGLALVTLGSIALSFRFGLPSIVLGLVGGFAAPALVGGEDANLPLLALYLGLVTAGLSWTGRQQQRPWLGLTALVGGLGWGALILFTQDFDSSDILALGLYFVVLGTVLPKLVSFEGAQRWLRIGASVAASVQLAALVYDTVHDPLAWGLYLLLGATLAFLAWRDQTLREASAVAAAVSAALLFLWDYPQASLFAPVTAALTIIFAAVPLVHVWRERHVLVDIAMASTVPLALGAASLWQFGYLISDSLQPALAAALIALACIPALAAYRLWDRPQPTPLFAPLGSSGLLVAGSALLLTPQWMAPIAVSLVAAALLFLVTRNGQAGLRKLSWVAWPLAALALIVTPDFFEETAKLFGAGEPGEWLRGLLRWSAIALTAGYMAFSEMRGRRRNAAAVLAALFTYGTAAQVIPAPYLGATAAALSLAACLRLPAYRAAARAFMLVALGWATPPLLQWLATCMESLGGYPVLRSDLPGVLPTIRLILPPAIVLAIIVSVRPIAVPGPVPGIAINPGKLGQAMAAALGLATLHIMFKQAFDIGTITRFEALGLAERSTWQALLLAGAFAAWRGSPGIGIGKALAPILAGTALAHFTLYSLVLHNPLWDRQAVGPTPLANLALLSTVIGIGAALFMRRLVAPRAGPLFDGLAMAIACLGVLAILRQAFAGSVLVDTPLAQTEDLLRSVAGIVLALAFLYIGSRTNRRSWRIGSLAVMLIAVVKVFVFDTAGLEGLLRIASFMALGLSLLGLGWFYTRVLVGQSNQQA